MKGHHARGPEETVQNLSPLVSTGPAGRRTPACLRTAGMPDRPTPKDASQLAPPEPGLRHRLPH